MSKQHTQLTYERAFAELSKILQVVQGQDVGLEELTAQLRRAKELIQYCQEQLRLTESELEMIFSDEEE
ncbi:MAG TPA: exodeoxyribonuclease VII small subunit [Saprospiraceae bacterium]|nr:exodeoxyribonuclease VII small subunit [Saprospiraceae bacterium]